MSFEATESPHSFRETAVITDLNGLRGVVASATALYAVVHWEDGREEEIEQGDPRFTVSDGFEWLCSCGMYEDEEEESEDEDDFLFGHEAWCDQEFRMKSIDAEEVEDTWEGWSKAGPRPENHFQEPLLDTELEAA